MNGRAVKPLSPEELFDYAVRLLAGREHSTAELRTKLLRRAVDKSCVAAILTRLVELAYLDDARYAKRLAEERLLHSGKGPLDVRARLAKKGVPADVAAAVLEQASEQLDTEALCRAAAEKKWRRLQNKEPAKRRPALIRSLLQAGFPMTIVQSVVRQVANEATDDVWEE